MDSGFACARAASSILKLRSSALLLLSLALFLGLFLGSAGAQTRWSHNFGDDESWNVPQYGTTLMYGDINGDGFADVCGRGAAGVICALSSGHDFNSAFVASNDFSDAQGFTNPIYYSTLRLADVNGDGKADACGRRPAGIYCGLAKGDGTFTPATQWTAGYSDADGWNNLWYAATVTMDDLNNDGRADICVRGSDGVYCSLSTGVAFGGRRRSTTEFSDTLGWANPIYYGSIRLGDVNGDHKADLCGRGINGIYCVLSLGDGSFGPTQLWTSNADYSNGGGWGLPQYSTTMMLGDFGKTGRDGVCIRFNIGAYCSVSTGSSFMPETRILPYFGDNSPYGSWNSLDYYGSLRMADINGDHRADVCGRGVDGIYCAVASIAYY